MATMVRLQADPVTEPVTTVTPPRYVRPARECADCRYSEIYAEQPRAVCTCEASQFSGRVLFSGQPVCAACVQRSGDELALAWCTPGRKIMHSRFLSVPLR
jgi:hypothetical protein